MLICMVSRAIHLETVNTLKKRFISQCISALHRKTWPSSGHKFCWSLKLTRETRETKSGTHKIRVLYLKWKYFMPVIWVEYKRGRSTHWGIYWYPHYSIMEKIKMMRRNRHQCEWSTLGSWKHQFSTFIRSVDTKSLVNYEISGCVTATWIIPVARRDFVGLILHLEYTLFSSLIFYCVLNASCFSCL